MLRPRHWVGNTTGREIFPGGIGTRQTGCSDKRIFAVFPAAGLPSPMGHGRALIEAPWQSGFREGHADLPPLRYATDLPRPCAPGKQTPPISTHFFRIPNRRYAPKAAGDSWLGF
jgi:hypothetical protein